MQNKQSLFLLNKIKKNAIFLILSLVLFSVSYFKVPLIFFQQDELLGFGLFIREGPKIVFSGFLDSQVAHFIPVAMSLSYGLYSLIGLTHIVYNSVALFLHLINGLLVYLIARRLLSRHLSAVIAVLIFFSSSVAAQLVMWPVINLNVISLTFSLLIWLMLVDQKVFPKLKERARFLALSGLLLLALFSLEYSAGLILFAPLVVFLTERGSVRRKISLLSIFLITSASYLLFRLIPIISSWGTSLASTGASPSLLRLFKQVTTYFGQLFWGQSLLLFISRAVDRVSGFSTQDTSYIENYIFPTISASLGTLLLIGSYFFFRYFRNRSRLYANNFLLTTSFIVFSSLPFLMVPGVTSSLSIISSRYMYFGVSGMAIFIAFVYDALAHPSRKIRSALITILVFLIIAYGTLENYARAKSLSDQGSLRLSILSSIMNSHKTLPNKAVFFTESDSSFYGIPAVERILPFQSGFGQTLLVWYSGTRKFPKEFFQNDFLWKITDQGYRETSGQGFGYFRDFKLLAQEVKEKSIPISGVFSFRYSSQDEILTDNTEEVRGRLAGFLVDKRELNHRPFIVSPSIDEKHTALMFDRKRDTFWNSEVPYATQQTVDIALGGQKKIAQVRIDSYNNKDQNEVGYEVSTSQDGLAWKTVFYSKRYPPGDDGYVDLFFEPQMTRFIRIQQIGFHQYATWVIHELQLYEATN